MRAAVLMVPLLLLTACKDKPDFEQRYDSAAKEIETRAKTMDADIAASEAAAKAAGDTAEAPAQTVEPGGKIPRVRPQPLPETVSPANPPPSSGE